MIDSIPHSAPFLSVLPPLLAIIIAIITHRVLVALGLGVVLGAFIYADFAPIAALQYAAETVLGLVWTDAGWNTWNLYLIAFLLILGVFAALVSLGGGTKAFSEWAMRHVKTRRRARCMTVFLGILIFIDDYFNCLVLGNVSRPVTDSHKISRANLAYLVDSTVAPVCVMAPISSWGAYIIALLGSLFLLNPAITHSPFSAFVLMVPMNFYAIFTLAMVIMMAIFAWHVGPMRRHDKLARLGELYDGTKGKPMGAIVGLQEYPEGKVRDLIVPLLVLVAATISAFFWLGYLELHDHGEGFSIIGALENTNPALALMMGGALGLVVILLLLWPRKITKQAYGHSVAAGFKAMLPAVYILLFAWTIANVVNDLGTGEYLANLTQNLVSAHWLPLLLFIIAALTAFSTGTSWGTFALMLPIALDMSLATEAALALPCMAAVLSGALWGDHSSPISDTTILSSTGAGCHHIDHVITQLPYTLAMSFVAAIGFAVLGFTQSVILSLAIASIAFFVILALLALWVRKLARA